jgi:recombination protein RecT
MNEVTKVPPAQEFRLQVERQAPEFGYVLKDTPISVERFSRVLITAVSSNPSLLNADRRSVLAAAMRAAQDGLLPDGREGAIVVFGGKAQWMPMIAGLRKLVRNSGEIATWDVHVAYEKDFFDFELGDEPKIIHKPVLLERGKPMAVYSVALLKSGEKSREIMSINEVEAIRKRSRSGQSGPWVTDFTEMARKTVARRHFKVLPMSTHMDDVIRREEANFELTREPQMPPVETAEPVSGIAGRLDAIASDRPKRAYNKRKGAETVDAETGEVTSETSADDKRDIDTRSSDDWEAPNSQVYDADRQDGDVI